MPVNKEAKIKTFSGRTWTDEELIEAVKYSVSIAEIIRKLKLSSKAAGNYKTVKTHIARLGLATDHLLGQSWVSSTTRKTPHKIPTEEILVQNSTYKSSNLLHRLIAEGLKTAECEKCYLTEWQGEKISFELDHINGDNTDNRIENLKILCPNCHSQTPTWRRSKTKRVKKVKKCDCGNTISQKAKKCLTCHKKARKETNNYPSIKEIEKDYYELKSFSALGLKYKVSGAAVRKYLTSQQVDWKTWQE